MSIRLSDLQYPVLSAFEAAGTDGISLPECQKLDQRPFRSLMIRQWIEYRPGKNCFRITREGREAAYGFHHRNYMRKDPTLPLTAYFDPVAYGLHPSKKARVHVMPRRTAA